MYELYIEGYKVDIDQKISVQLTFAIDDVANFSSRETGFSKTIVLPGTGRNNQIFGYIYDLGSFNYEQPGGANIGAFFNVAQTSRAELRLNGLLVLKGVFRITNIIKDKDIIEYEGAIFGELAGFIAQIATNKLEQLDFSEYNHSYTRANIVNSWDSIDGDGYYYPLIDYGTYSTPQNVPGKVKVDYDLRTFRPALFVKEYIDKIFEATDYTYQSTFLNSNFFKRLIIPHNLKDFVRLEKRQLSATKFIANGTDAGPINFDSFVGANFTSSNSNSTFSYIGSAQVLFDGNIKIKGNYTSSSIQTIRIIWGDLANGSFDDYKDFNISSGTNKIIDIDYNFTGNLRSNFQIRVQQIFSLQSLTYINTSFDLTIDARTPIPTFVMLNDSLVLNDYIPKGILQKDFFTWIMKMFNLYITEDKIKDRHLIIEPYVDYYVTDTIDWTYKVDRSKPWQIKPMGLLNSRFFEYKYKDDNDFYNEGYKKKYNQSYGDRLEDTAFQYAKDKNTLEIGFSPTPLIQYNGTDKIVPVIYKKSSGNAVDQEERTDSNIRILQAKKVAGFASWNIKNIDGSNLGAALTSYGYAGHFDDPLNPTKDINFGAASEIYFDPNNYTTNNLFNDYWSEYIAEITDKDSKILSCYVHLTPLDIAQLDFSKAILIDGIRFRLNKIEDYDYTNNELVKVELLKVINNE